MGWLRKVDDPMSDAELKVILDRAVVLQFFRLIEKRYVGHRFALVRDWFDFSSSPNSLDLEAPLRKAQASLDFFISAYRSQFQMQSFQWDDRDVGVMERAFRWAVFCEADRKICFATISRLYSSYKYRTVPYLTKEQCFLDILADDLPGYAVYRMLHSHASFDHRIHPFHLISVLQTSERLKEFKMNVLDEDQRAYDDDDELPSTYYRQELLKESTWKEGIDISQIAFEHWSGELLKFSSFEERFPQFNQDKFDFENLMNRFVRQSCHVYQNY